MFFHRQSHVILEENIRFGYLLESPRQGHSNKYTKSMICKKLFKRIRYSCVRGVNIKFLYNSKFDFTAKSLVTNAVVIMRVLCIHIPVPDGVRQTNVFDDDSSRKTWQTLPQTVTEASDENPFPVRVSSWFPLASPANNQM